MNDDHHALDRIDAELLSSVRDLYARVDPTPSDLVERTKFDLTVRALQAEIAELVDTPLAATRGVDAQRTETITFAHGALSLMVNIGAGEGSDARVDGWVTSGGAEVEAVGSEGSQSAVADAHGRFVLEHVPRGPVYFVVRVASSGGRARPVITPTINL
jgi:hypothetical protein